MKTFEIENKNLEQYQVAVINRESGIKQESNLENCDNLSITQAVVHFLVEALITH